MTSLAGARVALVTDRDLTQTGKGNVQRIHALLRMLRAEHADPVLVAPRPFGLLTAPRFLGGDPARFDVAPFRAALAALNPAPDVAIAEYAWLAPALGALPDRTVKLVDLHDILHLRSARMRAAGLDPWAACTAPEEAALLAHAHGLIAITPRDAAAAAALAGRHQAIGVVTHAAPATRPLPPSAGLRLLFVGSNHAGNLAVADFAAHCLPALGAAHPGLALDIAGTICAAPPIAALAARSDVTLHGPVENLTALYQSAALVIVPVRHGSGLKIKTVEALAHGRAVVSLPEGVAGMDPADAPWLCAEDWPGMIRAITALLADPAARRRHEQRAPAYVAAHHSEGQMARQFTRLLEQCRQEAL